MAATATMRLPANRAAKYFLYTSIFWLLFAMVIGIIVSLKAVNPHFLTTSRTLQEFLSYGRIRPVHTNTTLFGWLTTGYFGIMLYAIPAMCKTPIYSERLALISCWLWNLVYAGGVISLFLGYQTGVEYAELPLIFDIGIVLVVSMIVYNLLRTLGQRKEKYMYVALWYFLGSLVWLPFTYIIGNIPSSVGSGMEQAGMYYFYLHNIVGMWFTPVGVGTLYYLLPKLTRTPIYSHKLSLIGFWTIAAFYVWNGPHHLINGPIPLWLMKAGIIPSMLLIIPVWSVLANFIGTMKGAWYKVSEDANLKMLLTGGLFYILTSMQGAFQALMGPNALLHFTYWTIGHAHMALFAGFSLVLFSGVYYVLPRILGCELYSVRMLNWHYWLSVIGFLLFGFAMWISGIIQGWAWIDGNQVGTAFAHVLVNIHWALVMRSAGGSMMFLGQIVFAWNIYKTSTARQFEAGKQPMPAAR